MLVSNISLFESRILELDQVYSGICSWARYREDIVYVWSGHVTELRNLLEILNQYHPSINFNIQVGGPRINYFSIRLEEHH